ncbi:DUF3050 domain-containing protein [Aliikangiella sp. IMCC44359]|uniref:DUF3050 domain-containing protein n=1 Tax=Aliikangiella sp. IMCC44359 TaxID=3459125 RepID=UPI00403A9A02
MLKIPEIEKAHSSLTQHKLYSELKTLEHIRVFMESHVFAVWDFMSLLKTLQQSFTCVQVPWVPKGDPMIRQMINEIVLGEESDCVVMGQSHFEWYLEAMDEVGADKTQITQFISLLGQGKDYKTALGQLEIPTETRLFVEQTMHTITYGKAHEIAASFTVGRENLIPDMFTGILRHMNKDPDTKLDKLIAYMERHIEVDGDSHGPLAEKIIATMCGTDQDKWNEVQNASLMALESRYHLWNGVTRQIELQDSAENIELETA